MYIFRAVEIFSEYVLEGMHCIYSKILSKQLQVNSSNCFVLETIGKEGKLVRRGGERRKELGEDPR